MDDTIAKSRCSIAECNKKWRKTIHKATWCNLWSEKHQLAQQKLPDADVKSQKNITNRKLQQAVNDEHITFLQNGCLAQFLRSNTIWWHLTRRYDWLQLLVTTLHTQCDVTPSYTTLQLQLYYRLLETAGDNCQFPREQWTNKLSLLVHCHSTSGW